MGARGQLAACRRLVVKVGSGLITTPTAGADQGRIVGPGQVENQPGKKPPEARAQAENHKETAVDLAKSALSEIARDEKGNQVDLGAEPHSHQHHTYRRQHTGCAGEKRAIGARKNKVAT